MWMEPAIAAVVVVDSPRLQPTAGSSHSRLAGDLALLCGNGLRNSWRRLTPLEALA